MEVPPGVKSKRLHTYKRRVPPGQSQFKPPARATQVERKGGKHPKKSIDTGVQMTSIFTKTRKNGEATYSWKAVRRLGTPGDCLLAGIIGWEAKKKTKLDEQRRTFASAPRDGEST